MQSPTPPTASVAPPSLSLADSAAAVPINRYLIFAALAVGGCAADLLTKRFIFHAFYVPGPDGMPLPHNEWWIWENVLGIEAALNHGALFGMGQGMVAWFAGLSIVAAVGIVYWLFFAKAARDMLLTIALGLITGGILGNLYDRLGLWGGVNAEGETIYAVRDWILIAYGGFDLPKLGTKWPNFNIADTLLVCGAGLLIWQAVFGKAESSDAVKNETASKAKSKSRAPINKS